LDIERRNELDISHKSTLDHYCQSYISISGDFDARFEKAKFAIENSVKNIFL
jgi:hypothetical protein